ncbi:LysM peptidoglycan-binding domain-containing protein [Cellulomonas sp. NS3]|uniref:LysM peptidoglycan-binding domain-containing protein n=1 Tax=Cellulomonas sp. NS3 TaxID=2973977 RepID=UPI0021637B93|nr:LysM peptidoglycan-binding domain-containing protein [Cellulomonas sp. NS3]
MGAMVISTAARGSDVRGGSAAARAREAWFAAPEAQVAAVPTPRRARPVAPARDGVRVRSAAAPGRAAAAAPARPATASLRRPVAAAHRSTVVPAEERPLRLTRRGRLVVLLLAALVLIAGVQGGQALADGPSRALEVTTYTVGAGETLWEIAAESALPGEDVRDVVLELQSLNGLTTAGLDAGQELILPVQR